MFPLLVWSASRTVFPCRPDNLICPPAGTVTPWMVEVVHDATMAAISECEVAMHPAAGKSWESIVSTWETSSTSRSAGRAVTRRDLSPKTRAATFEKLAIVILQ
jgi:hypothetical protein